MQWNSGIWWSVRCVLHPVHPLVWPFCTKDTVPTTIYHYSTASTAYCYYCSTASTLWCIHWFDLFVPKTMSPPPYTTILLHPLHTVSTASTGLTFLHQRQCLHHHIPLFHCIHWFDLFAPKTMSPPPYTTVPLHPLHTVSTEYWVQTIESPLCNSYTTWYFYL